jgi:hypothetical protein
MKKLLLSLAFIFSAIILILGGQFLVPQQSYATEPGNTTTTYSWSGSKFHDLEVNFQITVNPYLAGSSYDSYYWPMVFTMGTNGNGSGVSQMGLQLTGGNIRAIFQVAGATGCTTQSAAGTCAAISGGESVYYSLGSASSWTLSSVHQLQIVQNGSANSKLLWGAYTYNAANNNRIYLGEIEVPNTWNAYLPSSVSMQTVYQGSSLSNCGNLRQSEVQFTSPVVDAIISNSSGTGPSGGPNNSGESTACQESYVTNISGGVKQDVGVAPQSPPPSHTNTGPPPSHTSTGGGGGGNSNSSGNITVGSNSGSDGNLPVTGSTTSGTIASSTSTSQSQTNIFHFSNTVPSSTSTPLSSTASSLTNIKSKKHHSSTLATAASVTGIVILMILCGWGGYLLYVRLSKRKAFSKKNVDTDMYFDKTVPTTLPPPKVHKSSLKSSKDHVSHPVTTHPHKLTKEQLVAFGQEALLLDDLKEQDNKKAK